MVPRKSGLIVNITSMGGLGYAFNAAYGIGKAAVDRMAVGMHQQFIFAAWCLNVTLLFLDCGIELKKHNVAFIGLLLGTVKTEFATKMVQEKGDALKIPLDPNSKFLNVILMYKLNDFLKKKF